MSSTYADRLPVYLKETKAWSDFANALQEVLDPYLDTTAQQLLAVRDVNNIHPTVLAESLGTKLMDGSAAALNGIDWQDPSVRMNLAAMIGMNFYDFLALQGLPIDQVIKNAGNYYAEQGTPSWWLFLGYLTGTIVTAQQLWDSTAEVANGLSFGTGDGSTTQFYLRDAIGGFAPNTIQQIDWQGKNVLYPTARTNLVASMTSSGYNNGATLIGGYADPAGGLTAVKVTPSGVGGSGLAIVAPCPTNSTVTDSIWLRADVDGVQVSFGNDRATPNGTMTVTLSTFWQRFEIPSSTAASSTMSLIVYTVTGNTSTAPFYYAFPQMELGPYATRYNGTGAPLIDYTITGTTVSLTQSPPVSAVVLLNGDVVLTGNGVANTFTLKSETATIGSIFKNDWQGNQLQYSTPRTNSLLQSGNMSSSPWNTSNLTTASGFSAPDGSNNAIELTVSTATDPWLDQDVSIAPGSAVTFSCFVKQGTAQGIDLRLPFSGGTTLEIDAYFSFASGNWTSSTRAPTLTLLTPVSYGNGWWRIAGVYTDTNGNNTLANCRVAPVNPSTGAYTVGDTAYVWGAQLEVGKTTLSSYIETTTAPVTVTDYTVGANGLITFANAPLIGAALTWTGSISGRGSKHYQYLYPEGDSRIGTPVWEGGTWYPTFHYNIVVSSNLSKSNFNTAAQLDAFLQLLAFIVPIDVVINNLTADFANVTFSPALLAAAGVMSVTWLN